MLINERIIERMEVLGLKQKDLVSKTGLTRGAVSQWIKNPIIPSGENMGKLCEVLECTPEWLLGESTSITRPEVSEQGLDIQQLTIAVQAVEDAVVYVDGGIDNATKAKLIAARYSMGADCQLTELVRIFTADFELRKQS